MGRFLAGVASALLLVGAGLFWWTSGTRDEPVLSAFAPPLARAAAASAEPVRPPEAEERTREEKRFDRYDKDRDAAITADEYLATRRKAFAKLDANGDGRLGFEEWAKKTTDKFAKADSDRSAVLTRAEFATTKIVRASRPQPNCPPPRSDADEG